MSCVTSSSLYSATGTNYSLENGELFIKNVNTKHFDVTYRKGWDGRGGYKAPGPEFRESYVVSWVARDAASDILVWLFGCRRVKWRL